MSKREVSVALLATEREYMEALSERLSARHDWVCLISEAMCEKVREADLIVAESFWISRLRDEKKILEKTVFLMEEEMDLNVQDEFSFPHMVSRYDGFRAIERKLCAVLDALLGKTEALSGECAPVIVLGAWEGGEGYSRQIARELARALDAVVVYLGIERFSEKEDEEKEEPPVRTACPLEELLYYALDRLEFGGWNREESLRARLFLSEGVCFLPDSLHINPLWTLKEKQWKILLTTLCRASKAQAVLLWTGREELTRCKAFYGLIRQCVYLRPETEGAAWRRFYRWVREKGESSIGTRVCFADSWTELTKMVVNFHENVA